MRAALAQRQRLLAQLAPVTLAIVAAGLLIATGDRRGIEIFVAALVIAASLLLEVDLPWGGSVPLGHAVVIAVAVLMPPDVLFVTVALSLAIGMGFRLFAPDVRHRSVLDLAVAISAATVAAGAMHAALDTLVGDHSDFTVVLDVAVAGSGFLVVDLLLRGRFIDRDARPLRLRQAWPLELSLLCAAALLALSYRKSPALALVAAVPLLVTQFSFQRYTSARRTFAQTTQALSLLPEVAGLTPLGHGERTAFYVEALAGELGYEPAAASRLVTAARLHHIGHISLHEPEERRGPIDVRELGRTSAELLRETGFLADLADLVEQVQYDGTRTNNLDAAVIRVCSTLDDLAGDGDDEAAIADPFAAVLACHPEGVERTAAIALLALHDRRPLLIEEARTASRPIMAAATRHDTGDDHGAHDHEHGDACV